MAGGVGSDVFEVDDVNDVIVEQARSVLEDVTIAAWKVGFLGSTEGVSAVARLISGVRFAAMKSRTSCSKARS